MKNSNKVNILYFVLLLGIFTLTACSPWIQVPGSEHESSAINSSESTGPDSEASSAAHPESDSKSRYQLTAVDGHILLIPADKESYKYIASKSPKELILKFDSQKLNLNSLDFSTEHVTSIRGKFIFDGDEEQLDLYRFTIGDFTGYHLRNSREIFDGDVQDLMFQEFIKDPAYIFEAGSKDYTILQIFQDLYAIGREGELQMISQRKIASYDYETLSREHPVDLFPWHWTHNPICSEHSNTIFYLSSRDGNFYSIWRLDLDKKTEEKFGDHTAVKLVLSDNNNLYALMNQMHVSDYARLISTEDPMRFSPLGENIPQCVNGYTYVKDDSSLNISYPAFDLKLSFSDLFFSPLLLTNAEAWFMVQTAMDKGFLLRIDFSAEKASLQEIPVKNDLEDWQEILNQTLLQMKTFDEISARGIDIEIDKSKLSN